MILTDLYELLYRQYGQQGWWPILCDAHPVEQYCHYHPGDYYIPHNTQQCFQICAGAILTQNTSWKNVQKALHNLYKDGLLSSRAILKIPNEELAQRIKPSGYYNQKARKLKEFSQFFISLNERVPSRKELLNIWGIGKETADSMLLYGFKQPVMIIDTYTRRVFKDYGYKLWDAEYDKLKHWCEKQLPVDLILLQEFHALLVHAGKDQKKNQSAAN